MPRTLKNLIALSALAVLAALSVWSVMPPGPRDDQTALTDFSATRAFAHVLRMSESTHVTGSPANDRVQEYLVGRLKELGLSPEIQEATGVEDAGEGTAIAAKVHNIITVIPGRQSTGRIFLTAHYDSVETGPGANDDAAGVSAILETARALRQGPQPRNDVVLLFTDAEEACLCGAEAFVAEHSLAEDGGIVLNLEARGSSGPSIMFETSTGNADVMDVFRRHAKHPVATSFAVDIYRILPNDTDFTPFRLNGGFAGLNSAYIDGSAIYHRPEDDAEHMSQASLQHHGDNLLALTRGFAGADLATISKSTGADVVFFPVLGLLVSYPAWLVLPLAVLALLAVFALGWMSVRSGLTSLGRVVGGFGLTLIPVIGVPVVAQLFWSLLTAVRPGYAELIDPAQPVWYRWALLSLVAAILTGWYGLARRKVDAAGLGVGALAWLAVLGILMAVTVPGGSYLTALPALAGALAGIGALRIAESMRLPLLTLGAAVAVLTLAPTIYLFFPALGLAVGAVAALFALLLGLAVLAAIDISRIGWTAIGALAIAIALTGTGLAVDRFDERNPLPSQLMYALNLDTGKAVWASGEQKPGEWTGQYVSEMTEEPMPGVGKSWTGPAQAANLPAAQVKLVSEQDSAGGRQLNLNIVPQRPVRMVYLEANGQELTVDGKTVKAHDGKVRLLFHAPPSAGLELTVLVKSGEKLKLWVADAGDGLADLPGFKPRPADVGVAGSHSTDLVMVGKSHEL